MLGRFVFDANTLFPSAPTDHKIVLKRDLELFKFVPGTNYTEWLNSTYLGAKIYRSWLGTGATSDEVWPDDVNAYGYDEFLLRAFVLPMEDTRLAEVALVAIPVTPDGFSRLADHHVAKEAGGFPAVLVDAGSTNPVTVGPRPEADCGNFGLPCLPVLILPDEATAPSSGVVVTAARKLWENAVQPYILSAADWLRDTAESPVHIEDREVTYPWPRLIPVTDSQPDREGEYNCCLLL